MQCNLTLIIKLKIWARNSKFNPLSFFKFCIKNGGKLAEIMTMKEAKVIDLFLKEIYSLTDDYWIGLTGHITDQNTERSFVWTSSGKAANFTYWRTDEPNGDGDCVYMKKLFDNRKWSDQYCGDILLALCQRGLFTMNLH